MRDEFSFRSLKIKSDILEEKPESQLRSKNNSSLDTSKNNIFNNKGASKEDKVRIKIKEYFKKENQLIKENFDSFLSFIGLKEIWSTEEEQKVLWESIISKAKDQENINYEATLEGICALFEDEEDIKEEEMENFIEKNIENDSDLSNEISKYNENCIDEYLNCIKSDTRLIYGIKFINEFFLKKYIINFDHKNMTNSIKTINTNKINDNEIENGINSESNKNNNSNIEEEKEIEVAQLANKFNKNILINMNDILNEIKIKYRFIMINYEELNNYFKNITKNLPDSRKSITSCCIIIKSDKSQEYCLDKQLLKYVNAMIKIDSKTGNDTKKNENSDKPENEKIIINKEEETYEYIIENLTKLDNAISDIFDLFINMNLEKEIKNLLKMYNSNYIQQEKKSLYEKLSEIIKERKNSENFRLDETESQLNINQINDDNNNKIIMEQNEENDYLKQQINNLKERNEYLLKENNELKKNLPENKNEITLKNSTIKINRLNIPKSDAYNSSSNSNLNSKNYISSRDEVYFKNKRKGDENSIFNMLNQRSNSNHSPHCHTNRNPLNTLNLNKLNKVNTTSSNMNLLNDTNNGKSNNIGNKTNSFMDYNGEEFTNSKIDLFSVNGNNNTKENFLLETTGLGNEPCTPTLTPRSIAFDNKDENSFCLGDEHNLRIGSKVSAILSSREYYNNSNSKENNNDNNNKLINFNKKKKMSFGINNEIYNNDCDDNCNDFVENKNKFDFKYLSLNKKIKKLLLHNNENLNSYEIFSDDINYILNGEKKQKGILLITSQCFYILDQTSEMNYILRISHQLLASLSITKNNFNHLLLIFNEGSFIIIEMLNRIHLLHYLKELYYEYNYKKININFCDSFNIKLKNNLVYIYELKNKKDIILTPNFENAQKLGVLLKYQENFFSAYFDEKFIVLTSIGLIVFEKNYFNKPLIIIPIIGSVIKSITANDKKKLYCFVIKTFTNETFIFGSGKLKEINDWIKELNSYKDLYQSRMNNIIEDFVITTK